MRYPYDEQHQVPAPVAEVEVVASGSVNQQSARAAALLDTGADLCMIPEAVWHAFPDAPRTARVPFRGAAGAGEIDLYVVRIRLRDIPGEWAVQAGVSSEVDEVLLGRDILNDLRLLLDGPALEFELEKP